MSRNLDRCAKFILLAKNFRAGIGLPAAVGIVFITILALTACRGQARPTPLSVLTQVTPTVPATVEVVPSPVIYEQTALKDYTHPSGRFSLAYPQGWQSFERDDGVIFIAPDDQAGYSVIFTDVGEVYDTTKLNQYLVTFVAQNFAGEESNFKAIHQEERQDGGVLAQFSSTDPNLGQTVSQVTVLQKETTVFVIHLSAPEAQWKISAKELQALAERVAIVETQPTPAPQVAAEETPIWTLIGAKSNEFGFFASSVWEVVELEDYLVSVAQPENKMTFTARNFLWTEKSQEVQAATKAAEDYLETFSSEVEEFQSLPPTEFPLDRVKGATIDFIYVAEDGTQMAGSIITGLAEGKMYQIVFTAPAEFYDAALEWFNPMYKSFKILSPDELPVEETP